MGSDVKQRGERDPYLVPGEGEPLVVECFVPHPITEGSNGDKERPKGQVAEYFNFEYFNSANKNYGSILLLR